jgi:hypothetical protein
MSSHSFNPKRGPILVEAEATGQAGSTKLKLLLDTGATIWAVRPVLRQLFCSVIECENR